MNLDESLREMTFMEREGYPYIIHPLLDGVPRVDPALLQEFVAWAQAEVNVADATVLLAPEAMGLPLATALSLASGVPFVVARKREYGLDDERIAYCETGYGQSCIYLNDVTPRDRVLIVDDVISTGGTLTAIVATLQDMDVQVLGVLAPISKGDGAAVLRERGRVPVHVMRNLRFENGRFVVEDG